MTQDPDFVPTVESFRNLRTDLETLVAALSRRGLVTDLDGATIEKIVEVHEVLEYLTTANARYRHALLFDRTRYLSGRHGDDVVGSLEALPTDTIVQDVHGTAWQKDPRTKRWHSARADRPGEPSNGYDSKSLSYVHPFRVLFHPVVDPSTVTGIHIIDPIPVGVPPAPAPAPAPLPRSPF